MNLERNKKIVALHHEHKTQVKIAAIFHLTRQRVQQILASEGIKGWPPSKHPLREFICKECRKRFLNQYRVNKFCSTTCFIQWRKMHGAPNRKYKDAPFLGKIPSGKEKGRIYMNWYYHNIQKFQNDFKEKIKESNKRAYEKRKTLALQKR